MKTEMWVCLGSPRPEEGVTRQASWSNWGDEGAEAGLGQPSRKSGLRGSREEGLLSQRNRFTAAWAGSLPSGGVGPAQARLPPPSSRGSLVLLQALRGPWCPVPYV